jgi:hypothetical protein
MACTARHDARFQETGGSLPLSVAGNNRNEWTHTLPGSPPGRIEPSIAPDSRLGFCWDVGSLYDHTAAAARPILHCCVTAQLSSLLPRQTLVSSVISPVMALVAIYDLLASLLHYFGHGYLWRLGLGAD